MPEQADEHKRVKRRPIVAALLSLLMFGMGQLYNGQLRRAVAYLALGLLPYIALLLVVQFIPPYLGSVLFVIGALSLVTVWIFGVVDAFISARRIGTVTLQRYNRWYVYVSIYLIATLMPFAVDEPPVAAYSLPSSSMTPSLLAGDYVYAHAYRDQPLERGDIAVFKLPTNGTDYIKRIVGLPGDRIQVRGGILHINGKSVQRESTGAYTYRYFSGTVRTATRYQETLPNGKRYMIVEESDTYPADNTPVYTVPAGHYFAIGDNRDNSLDSRYLQKVGFIPHENITGRVILIYFSKDGSWWPLSRLPQTIRFGRIGNVVE